MIYIPPQKTISIIPDLTDLPATTSWPRNQRLALIILISSGIWMIFAAGIAVVIFTLVPQLPYILVLLLLGVVTLTAFLVGLSALRQYASQDEVTIDRQGIKTTTYGWLRISKSSALWADVKTVKNHTRQDGYALLSVELAKDENIPIALSKNKGAVIQAETRLQEIMRQYQ